MASVAQITGSLISSGCNHIIPVRVSYDTMVNLCCDHEKGETGGKFLRDKYRYCAHKNDLLLCCSRNMYTQGTGYFKSKQAYPPVISNLSGASKELEGLIIEHYLKLIEDDGDDDDDDDVSGEGGQGEGGNRGSGNKEGIWCKSLYLKARQGENERNCEEQSESAVSESQSKEEELRKYRRLAKFLPDFRFMGFSCGLAHVHPSSGDTVVSSYIGGMITVRNGHFPMKTGDMVMWYFEFECNTFDENGRRPRIEDDGSGFNGDKHWKRDAFRRYDAYQRENGNIAGHGRMMPYVSEKGGSGYKTGVALVKPFFYDMYRGTRDRDRERVFGRCMSNARPFDMVDLQVCSQAI